MRVLGLLGTVALMMGPFTGQLAIAQPISGEPPTPGVLNPNLGVAGETDASAVEKNPALLGYLRSWSGIYLHSELDEHGRVSGRGDGFFFASSLPYLTSLALGAGVQLIRPPALLRPSYQDEAKFSLSFSWRLAPALSFGLTYSHLWSDKGPVAGGLDTLDLAIAGRLGRFAAYGLVVHDVPQPTLNTGFPLQRVYEPEVAVRPFGTSILEVAFGARFGERRGDIDPHFRLWTSPYPGVTLKADVVWRRDVDLDRAIDNDVRVALGIELDLSHFGLSGFGLFGRDAGQVRGHGFSLVARISGERYPTVYAGPNHLERINLSNLDGSRAIAKVLVRLRRLEHERAVDGVVVLIGGFDASLATCDELREALLRLRRTHRHVFAYLTETSTRGYYVASAAERIYQDPAGGIQLTGLSATTFFLRGSGELLGVDADFVKIGEYKSAPEMYTNREASEPARAQRNALMDDLSANLTDGIAAGRHLPLERVRAIIDGGPYTAEDAARLGLVDTLAHGDEVASDISSDLGRPMAIRDAPTAPERTESWSRPQVAVIFVEGDIVGGKSSTVPILNLRTAGLQTLLSTLDRARRDGRVRAIVLRINSPGGSALASDVLAREIERTVQVKPLICSLGDVAASGGYFIAAPCQRIFVSPSTVTGSIGIFSGKFDVSGLAKKLGVAIEQYARGQHATMESMFRPYTAEERRLILDRLRYYYQRFVDTVARGRGLSPARVDELGRGHVYSGVTAKTLGLADELGGLTDAIAFAKAQAGLKEEAPVDLLSLPEEPSLLGQLASIFGISTQTDAATPLVPVLSTLLRALPASLLLEPEAPQARLEMEIQIR
jgi:protease-4